MNTNKQILTLDDIFFKDCFTEQDGNINESINKLTLKCLTSVNNNFSLDCDGNLSVNSITTRTQNTNPGESFSFEKIYPIGSYYETSDENFNPNNTWGGTWVLDSAGRVTVSQDTSQSEFKGLGKTGGEKMHQLTIDEMPSHRHTINLSASSDTASNRLICNDWTWRTQNQMNNGMINSSGNDVPHNNLQPYIVVNRWHRIG